MSVQFPNRAATSGPRQRQSIFQKQRAIADRLRDLLLQQQQRSAQAQFTPQPLNLNFNGANSGQQNQMSFNAPTPFGGGNQWIG
jgi:hypothetical protein